MNRIRTLEAKDNVNDTERKFSIKGTKETPKIDT